MRLSLFLASDCTLQGKSDFTKGPLNNYLRDFHVRSVPFCDSIRHSPYFTLGYISHAPSKFTEFWQNVAVSGGYCGEKKRANSTVDFREWATETILLIVVCRPPWQLQQSVIISSSSKEVGITRKRNIDTLKTDALPFHSNQRPTNKQNNISMARNICRYSIMSIYFAF